MYKCKLTYYFAYRHHWHSVRRALELPFVPYPGLIITGNPTDNDWWEKPIDSVVYNYITQQFECSSAVDHWDHKDIDEKVEEMIAMGWERGTSNGYCERRSSNDT